MLAPHDYQAKPEDVRTPVSQCAGENGLGLEEYVEDLVANANTQSLKIIDTSEGVQTISNEELEGHEHAAGEDPLESKLRQAVMNMKENLILTFGSTQSGDPAGR